MTKMLVLKLTQTKDSIKKPSKKGLKRSAIDGAWWSDRSVESPMTTVTVEEVEAGTEY